MQPKRLLQVTGLLLLSAAVLGQTINAALQSAAIPAELRPAAFECFKEAGDGCLWGNPCNAKITDCQLCQADNGSPKCKYCRAGFYLKNNVCTRCYGGYYCAGQHAEQCPAGAYSSRQQWSSLQCTSCLPGRAANADGCPLCPAGTAKKIASPKECDFCLDGWVANANLGATDCLTQTTVLNTPAQVCASLVQNQPAVGPTAYIGSANACGCPAGFVLKPAVVTASDSSSAISITPATCITCTGNTVPAVDPAVQAASTGLTACITCPTNTRAVAGPITAPLPAPGFTVTGNVKCECLPNTATVTYSIHPNGLKDGCIATPVVTGPAGGGPGAGGPGGRPQEWGHWAKHSKHGRKYGSHKGEDEYESDSYEKEDEYEKYPEEKEYDDRK